MKKIFTSCILLFLAAFTNYAISQPFLPFGSASVINAATNEFRLTPDDYRQTGAVWSQTQLDFKKCFKINAQLNFGSTDADGADGIAFVISSVHTGTGTFGGSLGYAGISPALDVEFDDWDNFADAGVNDPPQDHIAFMENGNIYHTTQNNVYPLSENIETGVYIPTTFEWDPTAHILKVTFLNHTYSYTKDIAVLLGSTSGYFGFTAGTGERKNLHRVIIDKVQNNCETGCFFENGSTYYGGFEAGKASIFPPTTGSDLYYGLPRNGSYEIVKKVSELGGGGYLDITPHSGSYFLASHTSNDASDRVWYSNVVLTPGATYSFCAYVSLLKNLGSGAKYVLGVYANGVEIGTGRVNFGWSQICGTFTAPANGKVELSIRDPKKGLFFVAIDDICLTKGVSSKTSSTSADAQVLPTVTTDALDAMAPTKITMGAYPNPTGGLFRVTVQALNVPAQVMIADPMGKAISTTSRPNTTSAGQTFEFNLSAKPAGMYVVHVTQGQLRSTYKVFVVR